MSRDNGQYNRQVYLLSIHKSGCCPSWAGIIQKIKPVQEVIAPIRPKTRLVEPEMHQFVRRQGWINLNCRINLNLHQFVQGQGWIYLFICTSSSKDKVGYTFLSDGREETSYANPQEMNLFSSSYHQMFVWFSTNKFANWALVFIFLPKHTRNSRQVNNSSLMHEMKSAKGCTIP